MTIIRSEYSHILYHLFTTQAIQIQINEVMGATINQLTNRDLLSFRVPVSKKLIKTNAISMVLTDIDSLITSLAKLIEKKKLIKQVVMQEILTRRIRLI